MSLKPRRLVCGLLLMAATAAVGGCLTSVRLQADRAFERGELQAATTLYERLETRSRVDTEVRFRLAVLYSLEGAQQDRERAARQLRALVARSPRSPLGRAAALWLARELELRTLEQKRRAADERVAALTAQIERLDSEAQGLSRRVASEYEGRRQDRAARAATESALERERERIASLEARVAELESELARLKAIDLDTPP